jgi:hypothetical protein
VAEAPALPEVQQQVLKPMSSHLVCHGAGLIISRRREVRVEVAE